MGGGAFANAFASGEPTLTTPRLSPKVYQTLKALYLGKAQEYFADGEVVCLIEAPGKVDYGDIDFVVALDWHVDFLEFANHLGAAGVIDQGNDTVQKCTLAVRQDGVASERLAVLYKHRHTNASRRGDFPDTNTVEAYAQIDLEVVAPALLEWYTFYSSYSDLAGILGHIITNLGFTITDRGFWLRMKELDLSKSVAGANIADRDGMIFLTSNPTVLMRFLALAVQTYDEGFSTLEALYEWLGTCRLLCAEALKLRRDKAHERNREQNRGVYSRFFFEWLPEHMDMEIGEDKDAQLIKVDRLRHQYLEEALGFFSTQSEYDNKHGLVVRALNNARASNLLKPIVRQHSGREDKGLTEIMRAIRRYMAIDDNLQPQVLNVPYTDEESQLHRLLASDFLSLKDPENVSEWLRVNWETLRAKERQRGKKP